MSEDKNGFEADPGKEAGNRGLPPVVPSLFRILGVCAALLLAPCAEVLAQGKSAPPPATQAGIEQAQKELDSFVGKNTYDIDYESLGWELWTKQTPLGAFGANWAHGYHVFKKNRFYGVLVSDLIPDPKVKPRANTTPRMISRNIAAFVFPDIPKGHWPSVSCFKLAEFVAHHKRCEASSPEESAINCGLLKHDEVLAFVKLPSRCAVGSKKIHSAYRYDSASGQLKPWPWRGAGFVCYIEEYSLPDDCPAASR